MPTGRIGYRLYLGTGRPTARENAIATVYDRAELKRCIAFYSQRYGCKVRIVPIVLQRDNRY